MPTCTRTVRARRNRRAPKWAAALAVVFAFGGGEAAAQLTADDTFHGNGLKVDVAEQVTEGANATIAVTLKASVAANTPSTTVTVSVEVESHGVGDATSEKADVSLNPGAAMLTFPANTTGSAVTREVSGTILLQTNHDPDAEDETVVLAISASGGLSIRAGAGAGDEPLRMVTVDDDETQSYVLALTPGAAPREGAPFDVTVRADPEHEDGSKTLTLQIRETGYSLDTDDSMDGDQLSGILDGDNPSFTAAITPPVNDKNRVDDTVTVTAYSGTAGNATEEDSQTIRVADTHALPAPTAITVVARDAANQVVSSVSEDGDVELTISVDRGRGRTAATGEALSVALSLAPSDPAQASTYRLAPASVALPAVTPDGMQSAATAVRLEAFLDEFVNDDRLVLNLVTTGESTYGAGSVESSFEIAVEDTTVKQIAPKPDSAVKQAFEAASAAVAGADGLNPGEAFSVAVSDLFEGMAPGSTVVYSATSSDPSVQVSASTTAVTVTAVSGGSAVVRVNARVTGFASAVPQTRSDEAAIEHTVTVGDLPLQVSLTADPPAAVEEGGAVTLTAAANRAVLAGEDATVRLTLVGPVVEPAPSSMTIAVGEKMASVMFEVVDDDEVKDLGEVVVVATGDSLETDPTRLDIAVTENDAQTVHTYTFAATATRVTEGGEIQLVVTAAPAVTEETLVSLTASPRGLADDFTLDPPAITLAAGSTNGTAVLEATDDEVVEDTETLTLTATDPGKVLIGAVEIMIVDNDTVDYRFQGPSDENLVEGETYDLKVWASAASSRDAVFVVRRGGSDSVADEDDFTLDPTSIVIEAGAREATAALKVADDGVDERSETLVLVAVAADGGEVGSLMFTLWDAAVPFLPFAARLLLAVCLAVGGYRRLRRFAGRPCDDSA